MAGRSHVREEEEELRERITENGVRISLSVTKIEFDRSAFMSVKILDNGGNRSY